ncbi:bifunctional glutamate N-acetyltransferase/amino-acid acetyltransferase ArgJ [Aureliella helgolandensis]|uniref:Arginine biosynthesis bifunctional protein ArgJ n=1 Tax=Aureliella helgolandensis TaxID=2527968 RepID=A0A518FZI3_9BACT|nr:bifunctional glutamate N-acetyltransferase/amino-acid acetyltransferase ArgJ [Aureliella helgolandensis]QDV21765.1 Arginine biosynthesis bifunctional protein ArgJ [Aureliella helgolandensis]
MTHHLPVGFRFAGVGAGIKASGKKDVTLIVSDTPAAAAGVYTQNQVVAAPVVLCRGRTPLNDARAVVINSGNANACTGAQGAADAARMCEIVASCYASDVQPEQTLVMSTGVIGHFLPMEKVEAGIRQAASQLDGSQQAFLDASDGILTTDIGRKVTTRECRIGGRTVRIAGIAKGAGMIGPNMATMLCCVFTDAPLSAAQAQHMLSVAANKSFNNISVEGHTSTNDTMVLLANGQAGGAEFSDREQAEFAEHLEAMCIELAKQIPTDGEGATHLIEVRVSGAASEADARKISHTVASSNLVKTAVYGCDPNWGRIVSAAGYAGVPIESPKLCLKINGIALFENGEPLAFDAKAASASIKNNRTTLVELAVGQGDGACTHWTSDLTVAYVEFNSEYTT